MSLVVAVLLASLLGSVHCAAMCGGFVCFYSAAGLERGGGGRAGFLPHAAYNVGRLATYAALGALAGAIGARLDRVAALAGMSRAAAILAGALMVAWGALRLAAQFGARLPRVPTILLLQERVGRGMAAAARWSPVARAAAIGLLSAFLPCGWLYMFVVTAGGTGSAAWGALVMTVFWAGTLPMLLAIGVGIQRAAGPLQRRLPALSAALVVLIGLLAIGGRLRAGTAMASSHASSHAPLGSVPHGSH